MHNQQAFFRILFVAAAVAFFGCGSEVGGPDPEEGDLFSSSGGSSEGLSSSSVAGKATGEIGGNALLKAVSLSVGHLIPEFNPAVTEYVVAEYLPDGEEIAALRHSVTSLTVAGTPFDPKAVVGGDHDIPQKFTGEEGVVSLEVTAADGETRKEYTFFLYRHAPLRLSSLAQLKLSAGVLRETFHSDSLRYTVRLGEEVEEWEMFPEPYDPYATVSGTGAGSHRLDWGKNEFVITVTGENGSTRTDYVIQVYRDKCFAKGGCSTMIDTRDGEEYPWVELGGKVWLAHNLRFGTMISGEGSRGQGNSAADSVEKFCYDDQWEQCDLQGALYQWHSAMGLPATCSAAAAGSEPCRIGSPHRGICPAGWHVPTNEEWFEMVDWVDLKNDGLLNDNAGDDLKMATFWEESSEGIGPGVNTYGWNGMPTGLWWTGQFLSYGYSALWWTADEFSPEKSVYRFTDNYGPEMGQYYAGKREYAFALRCVKDELSPRQSL